jgi:hypothetical protein
MNTTLNFKLENHDGRDDEWLFEDPSDYPDGYVGQELRYRYVFVPEVYHKALRDKNKSADDYLMEFAQEVALGESERAREYLRVYPIGQRYLWAFPDDDFVLLSLVALLPIGPRSVMWIGLRDAICDGQGDLLHHGELCARWTIETSVGTSTHPDKL